MNKKEFLTMMLQDIETLNEIDKRKYSDVIDCMELALSQTPNTVDIAHNKSAAEISLFQNEWLKWIKSNNRKRETNQQQQSPAPQRLAAAVATG